MPAPIERVSDLVGNAGHFRLVLAKPVHGRHRVGDQLAAIDLVVIGGQREIGAILLRQMQHPMRKFDVAIAGAFGLPQGLDEGLVANAIQFAGNRLDADVCAHVSTPPGLGRPFFRQTAGDVEASVLA